MAVRPLFPEHEQSWVDEFNLRMPLDWNVLAADQPPPRTWHIQDWLTTGPTLMAGAGGVGKTLLAQTMATALALGLDYIGPCSPQPVLMWACEDDHDELWRRQVAICNYFGVPLTDLVGKLYIEPRLGRENTLFTSVQGQVGWTPLRNELREQVNDYGARVLFLDNVAQVFGANEIVRHDVTTFCNGLAGLRKGLWSPIILAHPGRAQGSEFSGSSAWENAVRMRWFLGTKMPDQKADDETDADMNVRYLSKRKTNYSVKDYTRLVYQNGVFRPDIANGGIAASLNKQMREDGADRAVLHALAKFADMGVVVVRGSTSSDYLPKQMADMRLAVDYTRKELAAALNRLLMLGTVVETEVGTYSNRTPRRGLRLA